MRHIQPPPLVIIGIHPSNHIGFGRDTSVGSDQETICALNRAIRQTTGQFQGKCAQIVKVIQLKGVKSRSEAHHRSDCANTMDTVVVEFRCSGDLDSYFLSSQKAALAFYVDDIPS